MLSAYSAAGDDVAEELLIDDAVVPLLFQVQPEQHPHFLFLGLVGWIHLKGNTFKEF